MKVNLQLEVKEAVKNGMEWMCLRHMLTKRLEKKELKLFKINA